MTTIGFPGAGRTCAALVPTLLKSGHTVNVRNRTAAPAVFGATPKPTPQAAGADADIAVVNAEDDLAMLARCMVAT